MIRGVMLTFGVLFTVLIIIQMQGNIGGSWTAVGQVVAGFSVALIAFGFVAAFLKEWI